MPQPGKETRELVALRQWQIEETEKAIHEADRGKFASAEKVQQVLSAGCAISRQLLIQDVNAKGKWVSVQLPTIH